MVSITPSPHESLLLTWVTRLPTVELLSPPAHCSTLGARVPPTQCCCCSNRLWEDSPCGPNGRKSSQGRWAHKAPSSLNSCWEAGARRSGVRNSPCYA